MLSPKENEIINKAIKCWQQGHHNDAFSLLKQVVDPKLTEIIPLLNQMLEIATEAGSSANVKGVCELLILLEPRSETISLRLFHSLWEAKRYDDAIREIDRFTSHSSSNCYEEIATSLLTVLDDAETDTRPIDVSVPSTDSRVSRGLKPRWDATRNPADQLDGIERKQRRIRQGKNKGVIDSIKKSKQRLKQDLDRIKSPEDIDTAGISQSTSHETED